MSAHPTQPHRRNLPGMLSVIWPLIEEDFKQTTTDKDTNGYIERQVVHLVNRKTQSFTHSLEPKKDREEAERITQTIEPQIETSELSKDWIKATSGPYIVLRSV